MKRLLLAATAIATLTAFDTAGAADLPVKAPPLVPVVAYGWTGCYVGANAGWKWGRYKDSASVPLTTGTIPGLGLFTVPADSIGLGSTEPSAGAYGGQIGCRWETPQNWVFGFEGDFDGTNLRATSTNRGVGPGTTFVPGDSFTDRMRWESSARVVVGHTWDRFLAYATGGVAFSEVSMASNFISTIGTFTNGTAGLYPASTGSESKTLVGLTVGAGVAYALTTNWEIGAEYRFTSYERGDFNLGSVAGVCGPTTAGVLCVNQTVTGRKDLQTSEVLVKLNYRFDWGAPIIAKY